MVTENMVLLDIVSDFPETEKIFRKYDKEIGKCLLCNHLFDTITKVTIVYGIDKQEILNKLNGLFKTSFSDLCWLIGAI